MINKKKGLAGEDKAAILLYALGPEASAPLVRDLDDATLTRLGRRMADLGKIERETVEEVVKEYLDRHLSSDPLFYPSRRDVASLLTASVGRERAEKLISELDTPKKLTTWDKLSRLKPEMIVSTIKMEHPQTIALILGNLDSLVASRVLAQLPENTKLAVMMRMSKIESVPKYLIDDIEQTMEKSLGEVQGESGITYDGMLSVVEILKRLEKSVAKPILEQLKERDEELYANVDRLLLVFDDLIQLSDRDVQTVLKHISSDDLVRGLKGASDDLADRFFGNMSQRAAEIMREDMQVMGPMKISDVEQAQANILKVVRKLDDDGAITLNSGEDMV